MWCLLARLPLKLYSGWFYTSLFLLFRSLSSRKLKFLSSLCCSTTVIRHIWNDTSHTCKLFSWYLYWYLMYVVKQWLQLHSILSCMYHTVVWVPSHRVFFRHLVSKKCKGCGYNVIFFFAFLAFYTNDTENMYM